MPCVRPCKLSFVKELTSEMVETFPDFQQNSYYLQRTGAEEKKLVAMACRSALKFYCYYKLLWGYRNLRKSLSGKK